MADTKTIVTTETVTETKEKTAKEQSLIKVPLFLAFAEYFGYVSPFMEWITALCEGKDIPSYMKKILYTEALSIFHEMKEEIDLDTMSELYDQYYALILHEYDENMDAVSSNIEELPF